jgi:hypothetical protein
MKKPNGEVANNKDELRMEYDFDYTKAKPNRFAQQLDQDVVVILLEPDVAAAFPTPEAVNEALRLVMQLSAIPTKGA